MATVDIKYLFAAVPDGKEEEFLSHLEALLEEFAGAEYGFEYRVHN